MTTSPAGRKFVKRCRTFAAQVSAASVPKASGLLQRYINLMSSFDNDVVQFRKVESTMNMLVSLFHWAKLSMNKIHVLKRLRADYESNLRNCYFKLVRKVQTSFIKWHPDYADTD